MERLILFFLFVLCVGCSKEGGNIGRETEGFQPGDGVFIINEGTFNAGNASVSFYAYETKDLEEKVFQTRNNRILGDVFQSMAIVGEVGYLVLNNSNRIESVDLRTFERIGEITSLVTPRYLLPLDNNKAYVSGLFSEKIYVVNLESQTIQDSINFPGWSEEMILFEDKVFISNPWLFSKPASRHIFIVDTSSDNIVDSAQVGYDPSAMELDKNGKLWVFCRGNESLNAFGGLYRLDPSTSQIDMVFPFSDYQHNFAPRMAMNPNKDTLYYTKESIFAMDINATSLPMEPIIPDEGRQFYGLDVSSENGEIFIGDAVDFQQRGMVYIYTSSGVLKDNFLSGVIPSGFVFY